MRCETCHGTGYVPGDYAFALLPGDYAFALLKPCHDCGGSGWAHCCEGERPNQPREHISSPDCWCGPVEDPLCPGLWIHNQVE